MTTLQSLFRGHHIADQVMTHHEIVARGISRATLRTALHRQELLQLRRGVYALAESFHQSNRKYRVLAHHVAVAKTSQQAALSHLSAALWWDAKVLHLPEKVHLSVASNRNTRRDRVAVHKNRQSILEQAVLHQGVLVTSPEQTTVDCAKILPLADALCIADDFLHRGFCSTNALRQVLEEQTGSGSAKCRQVASLMSPLADSPAETLARLQIHLLGFPKPAEQLRIVMASGRVCIADFAWEFEKVILEVDGDVNYSGEYGDPRDVVRDERRRQKELERAGWKVIRVGWNEVYRAPHLLKQALWETGLRCA